MISEWFLISGGQKSRVALADMASRHPDVIILVGEHRSFYGVRIDPPLLINEPSSTVISEFNAN